MRTTPTSNEPNTSGGAPVTPTHEEGGLSVSNSSSIVPVASTSILRKDLTFPQAVKLFSVELISNAALASWFFAFVVYFASFCSNKVREEILNFMDRFDPYSMEKLQAINFGSTFLTSLLFFSFKLCFLKKFEKPDYNKIPIDIFPFSSIIIRNLDNLNSTPITRPLKNLTAPAYFLVPFTLLNYATFVFSDVIKRLMLENKSKFLSVVFREGQMDPATAIMINAMLSVLVPVVLNALYVLGSSGLQKVSAACNKMAGLWNRAVINEESPLLASHPINAAASS